MSRPASHLLGEVPHDGISNMMPTREQLANRMRPRDDRGLSPGKTAKGGDRPTRPSIEPRPGIPVAF